MTQQHTPGPWTADATQDDDGIPVCVYGADGKTLLATLDDCDTEAVVIANARLIAAAPDLLAACRALLAFDGSGTGTGKAEREMARAAVRKAAGA